MIETITLEERSARTRYGLGTIPWGTRAMSLTSLTKRWRSNPVLNNSLGGLNALYQTGGPRSLQLALKLQF
jgi:hypothetical protein